MYIKKWESRDFIALILIPLQLLAQWILPMTPLANSPAAISGLTFALALASMLVLLKLYRDVLTGDWPAFRQKLWLKVLISIAGAAALVGVLTLVRMIITPFAPVADPVGADEVAALPHILSMLFAFIPLFVVFQEEIVLRHVLFYKHKDNKALLAIMFVVSAALFGLIHIGSFSGVALLTVPYMAVGAMFNLVYILSKNIWYVIGIHFVFNFVMGFLPGFAIPIMQMIMG